jgi:spore maturation protein CgeB
VNILCVLGEHNYGNPLRGAGYEYVNFLPALQNLGHQVSHFESFSRAPYDSFADMNRQLLKRVQSDKPELILFVLLGYEVWLETLELIRQGSGAILVNWSTDDSWKYEQFSRFIAPAFDLYATTYPDAMAKASKDGHGNFHLSQWAANSHVLQSPLSADQCTYPVTFVGTCYGNRPQWVEKLSELGIHIDCFGYGWPNGPVASEAVSEIIQKSVISLNFGDSGIQWKGVVPGRSRQIKARLFEVPGAGGFLMTESADGLNNFFTDGAEIVTFSGLDDLAEKIRFYLQHSAQRDQMAWEGHQRTKSQHTYEARFLPLLLAAGVYQRSKPVCCIDMERFESVATSHRVGRWFGVFRVLLLLPCQMLWGKVRGPRAARRILFELSWRLVGRTTYTASGWPGRLFYWDS